MTDGRRRLCYFVHRRVRDGHRPVSTRPVQRSSVFSALTETSYQLGRPHNTFCRTSRQGSSGRAAKEHCFKAKWLLRHMTSFCWRHDPSVGLFGLLNEASRRNGRTTLGARRHLGKRGRQNGAQPRLGGAFMSFGSRHRVGGAIIQFQQR